MYNYVHGCEWVNITYSIKFYINYHDKIYKFKRITMSLLLLLSMHTTSM